MRIWFISDTHFGHTNILKHCDRPFNSISEMDAAMIANINAVVDTTDVLYHLGDFARGGIKRIGHYREQIQCKRVILILGNHDPQNRSGHAKGQLADHFHEVWETHKIRVPSRIEQTRRELILCHYPIASWRNRSHGSWHLHGHTHGGFRYNDAALDLSVESWGYRPVCWDEVESHMLQRPSSAET